MKSWRRSMSLENRRIAITAGLIVLALIISLGACSKSEKPSNRVFASPEDAGNALLEAAKSGNQNAVLAIFGPESKEFLLSGDAVQDKAAVGAFVVAYGTMHRWRKMPEDAQVL